MKNIQEGQKAPDFQLADQDEVIHTLGNYKGRYVVLYFYPKDDTPGCTTEACSFRDALEDLYDENIAVLGVSKDSVASHKKFHEKYSLTFPLLSDEHAETIKAYESSGVFGAKRNTFLIGPDGTIVKIYQNVKPKDHTEQILADMRSK